MINYIIQVVLFQVVFLAVYDLFLQKETFFKWNRVYLLATPIISFIVPLLKFESFKDAVPQEYIIMLPEVILNPEVIIVQTANNLEAINYLNVAFYVGAGLFLLLFLYKLNTIIRLIVLSKTINKKAYYLVLLEKKQSAFSFFKYIFIAKGLSEKEEAKIIQHELVHSQHYHSLDLLFFELLKIGMWFNPMVYIYQKRMTLLHEYISDDEVIKATDKKSYFNTLLSQTFNVENISFANQFYKHSLIKKRIAMITKNKSKKLKQLKYLVLIPLLGGMLLYSSCESKDIAVPEEVLNLKASLAPKTYYSNKNGGSTTISEADSYLDLYVISGDDSPVLSIKNIKYEDLLTEEKNEADAQLEKFPFLKTSKHKISYGLLENGRKVMVNRVISQRADKKDYSNAKNVPFGMIDKSPIYPGCKGEILEFKNCLDESLQRFVKDNFNVVLAQNLGLTAGGKKIYSQFKILKSGEIEIVGVRAPHPDLEKEAKRVINLLPKMIPGEHNGKQVNVTYMLPILINVEASETSKVGYVSGKEIPTSVVEEKIY